MKAKSLLHFIFVIPFIFTNQKISFGQNEFSGSVPAGTPTAEVIQLSLKDAIDRGLHQNLGLLLTGEEIRAAQGQHWEDLSAVLPNVNASVGYYRRQINIRAEQGLVFPGFPEVIGPFHFVDARAFLTQLIDWQLIQRARSDSEQIKAAEFSFKDARELVVLAVSTTYYRTIADSARVDTAAAQKDTAQTLYQQAADQFSAGTAAEIDELRSKVALQNREQELIAARNDFAKQKLVLARIIGLPLEQEFTLSDKVSYEPVAQIEINDALKQAYESRADYKSFEATLHAAELEKKAAVAGYYPSLALGIDYGKVGEDFSDTRGTTNAFATLRIPIFEGRRVHGEILKAEARLKQSQQQLENLRAQIDQEVRNALLDLQSAGDLVKVAQSSVELADKTLIQSKDRFISGVADNIEVVLAQQSVANANESLISSLYKYNVAKIDFARATGQAESGLKLQGE